MDSFNLNHWNKSSYLIIAQLDVYLLSKYYVINGR